MKEAHPIISFLIITFNQEKYIRDALYGAFSQTYSPLEIIIADDGSTDNTVKVIEETVADYKGPHKVVFHHGKKNVGIAQNVNNAMALANGKYFIFAAGDDKSLPERAQRTFEIFTQHPNVTCINFNSILCDADLRPLVKTNAVSKSISIINIHDYIEFSDFVLWSGDTRSIHRSLYEIFGPFTKGKDEDSAFFMRGLLAGCVCHSQEYMSLRRTHAQQVSNFHNIKKHISADFVAQPMLDVNIALQKGLISEQIVSQIKWKIRHSDRLLADQYYEATSQWYRLLYAKPVDVLRRIKNKLFR